MIMCVSTFKSSDILRDLVVHFEWRRPVHKDDTESLVVKGISK